MNVASKRFVILPSEVCETVALSLTPTTSMPTARASTVAVAVPVVANAVALATALAPMKSVLVIFAVNAAPRVLETNEREVPPLVRSPVNWSPTNRMPNARASACAGTGPVTVLLAAKAVALDRIVSVFVMLPMKVSVRANAMRPRTSVLGRTRTQPPMRCRDSP